MKLRRYKKGIKVCIARTKCCRCGIDTIKDYVSFMGIGTTKGYKIGEWTEREEGEGPFAVFDSLKNALNFIIYNSIGNLFKCKFKKSEEKRLYFTNEHGIKRYNVSVLKLPDGTLFADRVKLIKKVNLKNEMS